MNKILENRIRSCLSMSKGTVPIEIGVHTDEELSYGMAFLKGKKHNANVTIKNINHE